jgi:uncharacterized cupredoxin-like copper-binding protein
MNKYWLLASTVALATVLIACGGGDDDPSDANDNEPAVQQLVMQDIAYDTRALTAEQGQVIRLELENRGAIAHDFTIERIAVDHVEMTGHHESGEHAGDDAEHDLHIVLEPGASGHLEFAATEPGDYEYFCTVPGHREAGMRGTLTVE